MKHTKGNWEPIYSYYKREPKRICTGVGVNSKIIGGTYTEFICNSILPDTDEEYIAQRDKIEANMKLIASAPDMLQQLTLMTALCRLKYGNLDKDVYAEILKSEKVIKEAINPA